MKNIAKLSIGKIVAADYRTAAVFKAFDIDFCCNGKQSLEEACETKQLDLEAMVARLKDTSKTESHGTFSFDFWPVDLLSFYIENKHHRYVRRRIPVILRLLSRLCKSEGDVHPVLWEIRKEFVKAAKELLVHMKREELILFPYIRKMVKDENGVSVFEAAHFDAVRQPILQMINEHEKEGKRFKKIAALTRNYSLPDHASPVCKITYAFLREFDKDLQKHFHLENNILFAKALDAEGDSPYGFSVILGKP
ncbi:DUF542 domain-containing protein [Negadavirga shengliensis]|uniref:DUF542 domain-containing protein n=1 Tax=Negadavirga shengliensis TaxID=1389218 RepID=A0ABV9SYG8_9BACT